MGSNDQEPTYTIRAVARVCEILDRLAAAQHGVSLAEIAHLTGMPKSSVFRYMSTLESFHYVERVDDGSTYRLGMAVAPLQAAHVDRLIATARPYLEKLRDLLGETINLGRLEGSHIVYLDIVESLSGVRLAARPGTRDPIHSTAIGKAIVSQLPEGRVRAILEPRLHRYTEHTITSVEDYLTELEKVRGQGYAVDDMENEADGRCVAVPLPVGLNVAISQSAPAARLPMVEIPRVARALRETADHLSARYHRSMPQSGG
jgi:IclR family transcriptional regulator, acetate operon repressor